MSTRCHGERGGLGADVSVGVSTAKASGRLSKGRTHGMVLSVRRMTALSPHPLVEPACYSTVTQFVIVPLHIPRQNTVNGNLATR